MDLITTTAELTAFCDRLAKHRVITVDAALLRSSPLPLLCVVQMLGADEAAVIDVAEKASTSSPSSR